MIANDIAVHCRIVDESEKKEIGMPAGFREQDLVNYSTIVLACFELRHLDVIIVSYM